jgi:hypothetical protein
MFKEMPCLNHAPLISIYAERLKLPPYIAQMAVRLMEISPPPKEELPVNINSRNLRPDRDGARLVERNLLWNICRLAQFSDHPYDRRDTPFF